MIEVASESNHLEPESIERSVTSFLVGSPDPCHPAEHGCTEKNWRASHNEPSVIVRIDELLAADSPRAVAEDLAHIQSLAETDAVLPPILVHRNSMRVIDGMHRLRAAQLRGADQIEVQFFDGTEDEAFVMAVKSNIAHGLPLSLAERKSAAARIIKSHPRWSDRVIAATTGLSHKTIGAIRRRSPGEFPRATVRLGQDGRAHPLATAEGRRRASELMKGNPDATMQEIARAAAISPTTAKDVRKRLQRGEDPVPPRQRIAPSKPEVRQLNDTRKHAREYATGTIPGARDGDAMLAVYRLRGDPSVRLTQAGRALLRYLDLHVRTEKYWDELADKLPEHCLGVVEELAKRCALDWQRLSAHVARRTRAPSPMP